MSDVRKVSTALGALSVLLFTYSASAYDIGDYELTGIPPSGSPNFEHPGVSVHMSNKKGQMTIRSFNDFWFDDGSTIWDGTKGNYLLKASYDDMGTLLNGSLQIKGKIPLLGITKNTVLVTANISKWNVTDDPSLWGFATTDIVCSPLLLIQCTLNESVYVALDSPFTSGNFSTGNWNTTGTAITTVPIPAAAWLFGSGLALLGWIRRKQFNAA